MRKISLVRNGIFLLVFAFSLLSCSTYDDVDRTEDKAMIWGLLEQRAQGFEEKDLSKIDAILAEDYMDTRYPRNIVLDGHRSWFEQHPSVVFHYSRKTITFHQNSARMIHAIKYTADSLEKTIHDQETLAFRKLDGRWYIISGLKVGIF